MPDCPGLHSAQRAVEYLLSGYCDSLVRFLYIRLLFLVEWMTGCLARSSSSICSTDSMASDSLEDV